MQALAFGRLRLTTSEYYDMTPRELNNAVRGYAEQAEQDSRERWEQARLIAYYAAAPHLKRNKPMTALIPLPWDKPKFDNRFGPAERPTDEQIQVMLEKLRKTIPGWQTQSAIS